jgi:hypothetical protein
MDRPGVGLTHDEAPGRVGRLATVVSLASEPFVLFSIIQLTVLAWRLPLFDRLPGWFFTTRATVIRAPYFVLLAAVPLVSLVAARWSRRRPWAAVALLVAGGFVFQQALAWSEARGLDGMRDRIVRSGHAEFADAAVSQRSVWYVITRYEDKVQGGELGRYPHSKPPGTLVAYMVTERLSRLFAATSSREQRLAALRTTAAIAWPLVCYLVLVPLYALARRLADDNIARLACGLYLVVPSVALITLHTDQFLFPLLGVTAVWAATAAAARRSVTGLTLAGAALWVAGFFTFPLLLLAPVAAACAWLAARAPGAGAPGADRTNAGARRSAAWTPLTSALVVVVCLAAGFVIGAVAFRLVLGYDLLVRLADARRFNADWKGWEGGAFQTLYFAWTNLLEFALWIGVPMAALSFGRMGRAVRQAASGRADGLAVPALAVLLVFGYLTFFGQTKAETARLWLFMVPFCAVMAADEIRLRYPGRSASAAVVLVLVLQWLTVVLTKTGQDFF